MPRRPLLRSAVVPAVIVAAAAAGILMQKYGLSGKSGEVPAAASGPVSPPVEEPAPRPADAGDGNSPAAVVVPGESDPQPEKEVFAGYPAAADAVRLMEPGSDRDEALEVLIASWAAADPQAAAAWVHSLPAGELRADATGGLLLQWAAVDPAAAADWLASTGTMNAESASLLAGKWAAADPVAATEWVIGIPDAATRNPAVAAVAGGWATRDPVAAGAWVENLPAGTRRAAATQLVQVWAEADAAAAGAWVRTFAAKNPGESGAAAAALVSVWAAEDPAAASRWINGLPEGPVREAASGVFAVEAATRDPAVALTWAMNLAGEPQRNQTVADVCEAWFDADEDSFRQNIGEAVAGMTNYAMRKGVYEMLYERDLVFHDNLLFWIEITEPAPDPDAAAGAAPGHPADEASPGAAGAPEQEPDASRESGLTAAPGAPVPESDPGDSRGDSDDLSPQDESALEPPLPSLDEDAEDGPGDPP